MACNPARLVARLALVMLALPAAGCTFALWGSAWEQKTEVASGRLSRIWRLDHYEAALELELTDVPPLTSDALGSDHVVLLHCRPHQSTTPIGDELSLMSRQLAGKHTSSGSWRVEFKDRRMDDGVRTWTCVLFLTGPVDCRSSVDAPTGSSFRHEADATPLTHGFLKENSWRWSALDDRALRLYCPLDAGNNPVTWDHADDLLHRRELGLLFAAKGDTRWLLVTIPAEVLRLEPTPHVDVFFGEPRWEWRLWMDATIRGDAPPLTMPGHSKPLDVEIRCEVVDGPGVLDIAWRLPVSVVTIPLDLVALPFGFILFAMGFRH